MTTVPPEQIRPDHYKTEAGEQHWDWMWRLYREVWFVGNITKYVLRYRKKEGLKDLRKALTYLTKLIELEERYEREHTVNPSEIDKKLRQEHCQHQFVVNSGNEVVCLVCGKPGAIPPEDQ